VSNLEPIHQATVLVCITCRRATDPVDGPRAGLALAEATAIARGEAPEVCVQRVRCLGNCDRALSAAIRCAETWTYVFGNLDPACDAPALIAGARLLAQAPDGIMPWRNRPESLKRGLIARVPPLSFQEEPA
jgi:predicted metal-binding protein